MNFWRWYFGILKAIFTSPRFITLALFEYILGLFILIGGTIFLAIVSPLFLLITMPIGFTLASHGWWRLEN